MKNILWKLFAGLIKVIFKLCLIVLYSTTKFLEIFLIAFNGWLKERLK